MSGRNRQTGANGFRPRKYAPDRPSGFDFGRASRILGEELPDALFVNENPLDPSQLAIEEPGRYFASSPAGGLGWGLGAALGVKLGRPEHLVVCAVGDGAYMFGGPTPFHYTSRRYDIPVLTVVFNNRKWGGVDRAAKALYPELNFRDRNGQAVHRSRFSASIRDDLRVLRRRRVSRFADEEGFRSAIRRARAEVEAGRQALIDLTIS